MTRWEWLINNAKLEIYEFNVNRWEKFCVKNRRFPFYVMSYIKEGSASAIIEGKEYNTPAGSLLLVPAKALHSHFIPQGKGPTTFLWWHFNITVSGLDVMNLIRFPIVLKIHNFLTFENLFYSYMEFYGKIPTLASIIYRRAKEYEIMAFLFENILNSSDTYFVRLDDIPDVFFKMMQDIIEHPEQNASLQELSNKYFLSETYISNRFKKLFGISPIRLHNKVLIDHIKSVLSTNEDCTINELAQDLGFKDASTFTHFFSSRVGCSPTDYKKKYFS